MTEVNPNPLFVNIRVTDSQGDVTDRFCIDHTDAESRRMLGMTCTDTFIAGGGIISWAAGHTAPDEKSIDLLKRLHLIYQETGTIDASVMEDVEAHLEEVSFEGHALRKGMEEGIEE